jgi:predicted transcriptional regulator of viral defense system
MPGKSRKVSFANKVREILKSKGDVVTTEELGEKLDMPSGTGRQKLHMALHDMTKSGEIKRLEPGKYCYLGKNNVKPEIRDAMWAILRMRKTVSLDDLQELSGASRSYAQEFMCLLTKREVVEAIDRPGAKLYRLIEDAGPPTPEDNEKAARLRRIREAKQKAQNELDIAGKIIIEATEALFRARIAVNDIPEEETP